jgi:hypothetical protein
VAKKDGSLHDSESTLPAQPLVNAVIAEVRTSLDISDFRQMTSKIKSGK